MKAKSTPLANKAKMKQTLVKPAKMKQVPVPKRPTAKQVAVKKAGKR